MERIDSMDLIERSLRKTQGRAFKESKWGERHVMAWMSAEGATRLIPAQRSATAIVGLIKSWALYADFHFDRFESTIGEDGVLGKEWAKIGSSLRGLLNGDLGQLDGGTLDALILEIAEHNDVNEEDL